MRTHFRQNYSLRFLVAWDDVFALKLTCYPGQLQDIEFEFILFISAIRRFALFNVCDLNRTSWAASVAQLVERLLVRILPEQPFFL